MLSCMDDDGCCDDTAGFRIMIFSGWWSNEKRLFQKYKPKSLPSNFTSYCSLRVWQLMDVCRAHKQQKHKLNFDKRVCEKKKHTQFISP